MSIILRKTFCITPDGSSAEAETLDPRLRTVLQTNGANVSPVNEYNNGTIAHSRKNPTFGKLLSTEYIIYKPEHRESASVADALSLQLPFILKYYCCLSEKTSA